MKKLFVLFVFTTFLYSCSNKIPDKNTTTIVSKENNPDYKELWEEVNKFEEEGKPKSAVEATKKILFLAKKDKVASQHLKAVIHIVKYSRVFEEEAKQKNIDFLNEEIAQSEFPAKQLLNSVLAEIYQNYYQNNKYKIWERTAIQGQKPTDFKEWDTKTFYLKISNLHEKSLLQKKELQKISVAEFKDIIIKGDSNQKIRPTLFDVLAHRAINFYKSNEFANVKPIEEFEIEGKKLLVDAENFINVEIKCKDKSSSKHNVLKHYKELLSFHKNNKYVEAFVISDIERIKYVFDNTAFAEKEKAFYNELTRIEHKYSKNSITADAIYEKALLVYNGYRPEKTYNIPLKKTAINLCEKAIENFSGSIGGNKCLALQYQIKEKDLNIKLQKTLLPNEYSKLLIEYKNIDKIFVKIISLDENKYHELQSLRWKRDLLYNKLQKFEPLFLFDSELPLPKDYENHSTELKIPKLPYGRYAIMLSANKDFTKESNKIKYSFFQVTKLSLIEEKQIDNKNNHKFYVIDAKSGEALENVTIELTRKKNEKIVENIKKQTNKDGFFDVANTHISARYNFRLTKRDDIFLTTKWIGKGYERSKKDFVKTYFFTDRSIYRPGQTVYFKGIVVKFNHDKTKSEIITNYASAVKFYDVNRQEISKLKVKTNNFGSFHGSFVIPTGLLNGRFQIVEKNGNSWITVEEYKRPKFEVSTDEVENSFQLGDKVTITGKAKSYSGISISNAKVSYRIVRNIRYPYWHDWWRPKPIHSGKEIKHAIVETDDNGNFTFDFIASPDKYISKESKAIFNYSIDIDVTDINGETQSTNKIVKAGYVAVNASVDLDDWVSSDKLNKFKITTTNLDGATIELNGEISIYKVKKFEKLLRNKLWSAPDQFIIDKNKYDKYFPYDAYRTVGYSHTHRKKDLLFQQKHNSSNDVEIDKNKINALKCGSYEIVFRAKDTFGNNVEIKKPFILFDETSKASAIKSFSYFIPVKTTAKPGEKAKFIWGSADTNAVALVKILRKDKVINEQIIKLTNGQKLIEIPIKEEHRGGLSINILSINENRIYKYTSRIHVPWDNKKLDISFKTFRSKLEPGKKETWTIKIKGSNKENAFAEVLATMYDASLDAIKTHNWNFSIYPFFGVSSIFSDDYNYQISYSGEFSKYWNKYFYSKDRKYDKLNFFGMSYGYLGYMGRNGGNQVYSMAEKESVLEEVEVIEYKKPLILKDEGADKKYNVKKEQIQIRKNLQELAFFYPQLQTDKNGELELNFTSPEALTKWKLMLLAHSKKLEIGKKRKFIVTQKKLMLTTNNPRFLRYGDIIKYSSKLSNISDKNQKGEIELQLLDPYTLMPLDKKFGLKTTKYYFEIKSKENKNFVWEIKVPEALEMVVFRVIASTQNFSDGEENIIPIFPDKILVTESLPLYVKEGESKTFTFDKLINSKESKTLTNQSLSLEISSNPAWYAVMSLPYLIEFPYECNEQLFSRFYANTISSNIINSDARIKNVFEKWKNTDALKSPLQKNEELKSLMLEETPWVLAGKNETEQRQLIGLLFDENNINNQLNETINKLKDNQLSDGSWAWFKGMKGSRFITQYIISGFGHLKNLNMNIQNKKDVDEMIEKAIRYMDNQMLKDYKQLKKNKVDMNKNHLGYFEIQYLYSRSFYPNINKSIEVLKVFNYWTKQAEKYWLKQNLMSKAMISLSLKRAGKEEVAKNIIASLKEYSTTNEELGMYWKTNASSYFWYSAPIETQAILIEAFDEVTKDEDAVNDMKIWLLKQKQLQSWKTTKSTADACYALLLRGNDWLSSGDGLKIYINDKKFDVPKEQKEEGTGYFKHRWEQNSIKPEYGKIKLSKSDKGIAWGAMHWQYFEQMDKITSHKTPLSLTKEVFVEKNTNAGAVINKVTENSSLQIGDKVKIRIVLKVDRAMEFIHMKDLRATSLEPIQNLSGYKWQAGLGYYQSIKDASVNFFFDWLPKGTYVFEYSLRVSQAGVFQNGITTIQSMYAPEFNSHSEGVKLRVEGDD
ncbi:MAG: alpha-2-macroglobulin family protein [Bacteroidota bacterium]|nr:alpha-2-macroglobulin family protein [Bacteroidota bacterium]